MKVCILYFFVLSQGNSRAGLLGGSDEISASVSVAGGQCTPARPDQSESEHDHDEDGNDDLRSAILLSLTPLNSSQVPTNSTTSDARN